MPFSFSSLVGWNELGKMQRSKKLEKLSKLVPLIERVKANWHNQSDNQTDWAGAKNTLSKNGISLWLS